MADIDLDIVLTGLADYLTTLEPIGKAYYPFPSTIATTAIPAIIIEPVRTDFEEFVGGGRQNWLNDVRLIILKPRINAQTGPDFNVVNSLVRPVKDALSIGPESQSIRRKIPQLPKGVIGLEVRDAVYSLQYFYGGATYAASQLNVFIKFARSTPEV